ncbi:MAG: hypothetical protein WC054_00775 [Candidatus Nanopelagicales bacterium]
MTWPLPAVDVTRRFPAFRRNSRHPETPQISRYHGLFVGGVLSLVDVHDADTFRVVLIADDEQGVGFWPWLRLSGCDAPGLSTPKGAVAQQWTVDCLHRCGDFVVDIGGWNFDKRLSKVWIDGEDMSQLMISAGHAVPWPERRLR